MPKKNTSNESAKPCALSKVPIYSEEAKFVYGEFDVYKLSNPQDVFLDDKSNLYVVDSANFRILKYSADSNNGTIVAGHDVTSHGVKSNPELIYPVRIFVDKAENMYIVDRYARQSYNVIFWPNGSTEGIIIINVTDSACFGIYLDRHLNIWTSEYDNNRVLKWLAPSYENYTVVAGNGTEGDASNQLHHPTNIFINTINEELYVLDSENDRVQKFLLNAEFATTVVENINLSYGLTVDCHGNIYVLDTNTGVAKYFGSTAITGLEGVVIAELPSRLEPNPLYSSYFLSQQIFSEKPMPYSIGRIMFTFTLPPSRSSMKSFEFLSRPHLTFYYGTAIVIDSSNGDIYISENGYDTIRKYRTLNKHIVTQGMLIFCFTFYE